jgi:NAD(P)-dependent dehydrogenase (short-subunit alcohol dehydrogenase family)
MTDTNSFDQQVVLITAAASGLGRGIAIDLARHSATVHVWDRDAQALAELSSDAKSENLAISTRAVDLSNEREVEQAFSATIEQSSKIDVLINNAGGSLHTPFNFLKQSKEDWERVFNLNLMLTVKLTQLVIPLMIDRQYGRIINIGSKAGRYGSLFAGANYVAAKGAIHALTLQLAQEFGPQGITCNAICPGAVMTPRVQGLLKERQSDEQRQKVLNEIPVRRHGEVDDIANTIAFLASPQSGFITGVLLDVNGGQAMST